jgi:hypothetical protein
LQTTLGFARCSRKDDVPARRCFASSIKLPECCQDACSSFISQSRCGPTRREFLFSATTWTHFNFAEILKRSLENQVCGSKSLSLVHPCSRTHMRLCTIEGQRGACLSSSQGSFLRSWHGVFTLRRPARVVETTFSRAGIHAVQLDGEHCPNAHEYRSQGNLSMPESMTEHTMRPKKVTESRVFSERFTRVRWWSLGKTVRRSNNLVLSCRPKASLMWLGPRRTAARHPGLLNLLVSS